jgi:hypothetical protein
MDDRKTGETKTTPWRVALAVLLWALTATLSIVLIPTTLDAVTSVYAAFWGEESPLGRAYWSAVFIRQMLTIPLAMFAVAVIIGGAEFHFRNLDTKRSWRLLAYTLALEVALLLVALTLR